MTDLAHFWTDLSSDSNFVVDQFTTTSYNPDKNLQRSGAQSSQEMSSPKTEENGGKRKVHDIVFYIATLTPGIF